MSLVGTMTGVGEQGSEAVRGDGGWVWCPSMEGGWLREAVRTGARTVSGGRGVSGFRAPRAAAVWPR